MKNVLIISYYWPPAGGPGVQRVLKFARYLPEQGWRPIILTVSRGAFPAIDNSLTTEVPDDCVVYRTANPEPDQWYNRLTGARKDTALPVGVLAKDKQGWKQRLAFWLRLNLFIPDAKLGWKPFAVHAARKIIKNHRPSVIFSSSPPPTVHLIARKLSKRYHIPWIADFRDPWTNIHYYQNRRSRLSQWIDRRLEQKVVRDSTKAITVSPPFARLIAGNQADSMHIIPNGFDASDFDDEAPQASAFRLVYVGGLNANRFYPQVFNTLHTLLQNGTIDARHAECI
ncbi:MAG: glycosyltransferase, partial [Caldithrix sp.]|nr:glycosyltransferase [Caldithrix sp.]